MLFLFINSRGYVILYFFIIFLFIRGLLNLFSFIYLVIIVYFINIFGFNLVSRVLDLFFLFFFEKNEFDIWLVKMIWKIVK